VKHYDPLLREISFIRVRDLIRQAREKFPRAVIVYTGYFAPFSPGISHPEMKELSEHLSGQPDWAIWLNSNIIEIKDVDQLVVEAQFRAQFGVARALFWTRKAVAEANADSKLRGPGILFVHPQFGPQNTVFAENSFFHREYEVSKVSDAAKTARIHKDNCPRIEHADEMERLLFELLFSFASGLVAGTCNQQEGVGPASSRKAERATAACGRAAPAGRGSDQSAGPEDTG
jgi:hypothetical protein